MRKILSFILSFCFINLPSFCLIKDDFVEKTLDKNLKIKEYKYQNIYDNFAINNKNINQIQPIKIELNENIPTNFAPYIKKKVIIDGINNSIPIKISIKEYLSTKSKLTEGGYIEFITSEDIKINNVLYKKGSIIKGRIETITENKIYGVPADINISNFQIDNISLNGEINKIGANRSLWLYPSVCVGCIFFGTGLLLIPIRGGHAKIKPKEKFVVYY